jgi:DNA-directed RNA polymerase subunit H (RpoH/RPB5)
MARQSWNPGHLFWLHTLIGVPIGAVAMAWSVASVAGSAAVVLGAVALLLFGATASAWRLPRIRDKDPAARLTWAIAGTGIGMGATVAWAAAAFVVILRITCGSGGCDFTGMD